MLKFFLTILTICYIYQNSFAFAYHHLLKFQDGLDAAEHVFDSIGEGILNKNSPLKSNPIPLALLTPNKAISLGHKNDIDIQFDSVIFHDKVYKITSKEDIPHTLLAIYTLQENVEDHIDPVTFYRDVYENEYIINEDNYRIPEQPTFYVISYGNFIEEHSRKIISNNKKSLGTTQVFQKDDTSLYTNFEKPSLNARKDWLVPPTPLNCKLLPEDEGAIMLKSANGKLQIIGIAEHIESSFILNPYKKYYGYIDRYRRISSITNDIDTILGISRIQEANFFLLNNPLSVQRNMILLEINLQSELKYQKKYSILQNEILYLTNNSDHQVESLEYLHLELDKSKKEWINQHQICVEHIELKKAFWESIFRTDDLKILNDFIALENNVNAKNVIEILHHYHLSQVSAQVSELGSDTDSISDTD